MSPQDNSQNAGKISVDSINTSAIDLVSDEPDISTALELCKLDRKKQEWTVLSKTLENERNTLGIYLYWLVAGL
jgi:hypothetical protein